MELNELVVWLEVLQSVVNISLWITFQPTVLGIQTTWLRCARRLTRSLLWKSHDMKCLAFDLTETDSL